MALHVMGDAEEIAPQLAMIHRPFWGYLYSLCRWFFFLTILVMVFKFVPWVSDLNIQNGTTYLTVPDNNIDVYNQSYCESENSIYKRLLYTEPRCSASSDGYTFTITRAALWQATDKAPSPSDASHADDTWLFIEMKISNPRPWAAPIDYNALAQFWAEDSLGNYYYNMSEQNYSDVPTILGNLYTTGLFTSTHSMFTWNFTSLEAEWIDLHYNRSGRDITLRVDLTGGEVHED